MRTVLCTIGSGPHGELLDLALPSFDRFASRHGYELVAHRRNLAPGRPASWGKVVAMHDLVESFDRVVWIDADAVVVDDEHDLADVLHPGRRLAMVEHAHAGNRLPNAGVWVLKGGRWSRTFLERVYACNDLIDHPWWENAALLRLLGYRLFEPVRPERVTVARLRFQALDPAWNSTPSDPAAHPRIVHLAGMTHADRVTTMTALTQVRRPVAPAPRP